TPAWMRARRRLGPNASRLIQAAKRKNASRGKVPVYRRLPARELGAPFRFSTRDYDFDTCETCRNANTAKFAKIVDQVFCTAQNSRRGGLCSGPTRPATMSAT